MWKKAFAAVLALVCISPSLLFAQDVAPPEPPQPSEETEPPAPPPDPVHPLVRAAVVRLDDAARVNSDRQVAVTRASAALAASQARLTELDSTVLPQAQERAASAKEALEAAESRYQQALSNAATARDRVGRYTVEAYMRGPQLLPPQMTQLDNFFLRQLNSLSTRLVHEHLLQERAVAESRAASAASALTTAQESFSQASEALASASEDRETALRAVQQASTEVERAQALPTVPVETVAALQQELVGLLSSNNIPAYAALDPGVAIMGQSVLDADVLWRWYADQGYTKDVRPLIDLYLEEGSRLGVRGDIAFFQGVLETAGFTSLGASYNNFAGIGHCDSCPNGFPYPDARAGVRAQIMLLRAYADKSLTTRDLPDGPVAGLNVDSLGVKGCCASWWGLTGVWATALHYGGSILRMYDSALALALAPR